MQLTPETSMTSPISVASPPSSLAMCGSMRHSTSNPGFWRMSTSSVTCWGWTSHWMSPNIRSGASRWTFWAATARHCSARFGEVTGPRSWDGVTASAVSALDCCQSRQRIRCRRSTATALMAYTPTGSWLSRTKAQTSFLTVTPGQHFLQGAEVVITGGGVGVDLGGECGGTGLQVDVGAFGAEPVHRAFDVISVASDGRGQLVDLGAGLGERLRREDGVPDVGVARHRGQGPLRAAAAD